LSGKEVEPFLFQSFLTSGFGGSAGAIGVGEDFGTETDVRLAFRVSRGLLPLLGLGQCRRCPFNPATDRMGLVDGSSERAERDQRTRLRQMAAI
jgi:hypothetical protein